MSHAPEDRNRRIEAYVRGQADDETARQLEIEMLEDDELFERVQTEDLLRRGIVASERPASSIEQKRGMGIVTPPRLGWALAASLAAVAVTLGIYAMQLRERIESLQSPSVGLPVVTLLEQRSALTMATEPMTQVNTGPSGAMIEIDVSNAPVSEFQLILQTSHQDFEWQAVRRDERGYLTVLLPPNEAIRSIRVMTNEEAIFREYIFTQERKP